ncbi:hypothetical protein [Desulfosporosinus sp.]|uniref:hypothetical protein n=1 Tax=Desulfosporosinus sp. TaxID=157907 RepID=UPI00262CF947|nr:hypothetical protein [Desulfosporosinus sp.]
MARCRDGEKGPLAMDGQVSLQPTKTLFSHGLLFLQTLSLHGLAFLQDGEKGPSRK